MMMIVSCNNFGENSTSVAILVCLQTKLWAHLLQKQECILKPVAHSQQIMYVSAATGNISPIKHRQQPSFYNTVTVKLPYPQRPTYCGSLDC